MRRLKHLMLVCFSFLWLQNLPVCGNVFRSPGEDAMEYLMRADRLYCKRAEFCDDKSTVLSASNVKGGCKSQCPTPCRCDEDCMKYGDCCPNVERGANSSRMSSKIFTCESSLLKPVKRSDENYKMVSSCPESYMDHKIIDDCRQARTSSELELKISVTSHHSESFANKYCALCNGEHVYREWIPQAVCTDLISYPSYLNAKELLDVMWKHEDCNIRLIPPSDSPQQAIRKCGSDDTRGISACNTTGLWEHYDQDIEEACHRYEHGFAGQYRNPFCYVCNSRDEYFDDCDPIMENGNHGPVAFSAILDFTSDDYKKQPKCKRGYRYDVAQNTCREIFCAMGKYLKNGENCITVLRPPKRIYFELSAVYNVFSKNGNSIRCPTKDIIVDDLAWMIELTFVPEEFEDFIEVVISNTSVICSTVESLATQGRSHMPLDTMQLVVFSAVVGYTTKKNLDIDEVEELLLNISRMNHAVPISEGYNFTLIINEAKSGLFCLTKNYSSLMDATSTRISSLVDYMSFQNGIIVINILRTCPYVILQENEFQIINETLVLITKLNSYASISELHQLNESAIGVCWNSYFDKADRQLEQHEQTGDRTLGFISVVCASLSSACLFITFVIYSLIKQLRNLPGKNNMGLTINLLMAQVLFPFTPNSSGWEVVCSILGIAKHYMWLSTLLWMNVCSLHMFRVFRHLRSKSNPSNGKSEFRVFIPYCLYCHLVPIIFVCINISISLTGESSLGYSSQICFISNKQLLAYTFALPIGVVVTSNIFMFIMVVISICKTAKSTRFAKADNDLLHVYFRLSTLTGSTWIFGFIGQWTGHGVFSYLFSITNTLQGVFIFVAFVCKRKILKFLQDRFSSLKQESLSHSASLYTVTQSSSSVS